VPPFDLEDLRARAFEGFVAVASLTRPKPFELPVGSGVYVTVRTDDEREVDTTASVRLVTSRA
jgi:hypothetical protein